MVPLFEIHRMWYHSGDLADLVSDWSQTRSERRRAGTDDSSKDQKEDDPEPDLLLDVRIPWPKCDRDEHLHLLRWSLLTDSLTILYSD